MVFRPGQRAGERRAARCAVRPLPARKGRGISWFHCSRFWRKFQPAGEGRRQRRRGPVFPRDWLGRHRAAGRAKRARAPPCRTGLRRSPVLPTQCASERTLFFVLKSVRDAACGGDGPGEAFFQSCPFPYPGGAVVRAVLRGVAASLSAAARGVSDTLPSHRAACSLRGALRGGSAASGSAGIGRRAGQSGQERRPDLTGISLSRRRRGKKSASPCLRTTGRRLRGIALV